MSEYIVEVHGQIPDAIYERELTEIVRCRDCKYYKEKVYKWVNNWTRTEKTCDGFDGCHVEPDGYCAWGERRFTTCKCGEEIELGDCEYAVCPSCGRMVRE